ncbi:MAG: TonB-dependent receptor [Mangrovibacterium sp.]
MKNGVFLCLISMSSAFAGNTYSQDTRLSLTIENATLDQVFLQIEQKSDYFFIMSDDISKELEKQISFSVEKQNVSQILELVLKDTNLSYKIIGRQIIVFKDEKPITGQSGKMPVMTQRGVTVTGTVTGPDDAPLPGVTITIEGTTRGVITDIDGTYSINCKPGEKLVFSFIGMESQIIDVGNQSVVNVKMFEKTQELEDVTIVAFGKQKKESVLASITTISPGELKTPSSNLTTSFAGRMAGMISYQRSGEPGADNAEFFIRGVTTFGYNKDPLILIDNIELTSQDLARLQPDDIESFSIMKDATATALYGARGANGVILVKTKEGREGKAQLSLRVENSISSPTKEIGLADPITYMRLHNEAILTRGGESVKYSDEKIDNTVPGSGSIVFPATDWRKELLKDFATNQRVHLNIQGGGDIARYYVAASFSKDNGILDVDRNNNFNTNIDLKTYTLRSNVNINVTKSTELKVSLSGIFDDYTGPITSGSDMYKLIMKSNPVLFPAKYPVDEDHRFVQHTMFGNAEDGKYLNPYAEMVKGYKEYGRANIGAQLELEQDLDFISEGLSFRGLFNTSRISYYDLTRQYKPFYYKMIQYDYLTEEYKIDMINPNEGTEYIDYIPGSKTMTFTTYGETALNYNRDFGRHGVSGLLVLQLRNKVVPNTNADLQASLPFRNVGLSGRFTYEFDKRFLTEFNFGYNGSERFSKENRFGFFPSVGAGWVISNEKFFEPLANHISKLKLRASYGLVGNDNISSDRFLYLSNVNMNNSGTGAGFGYEQNAYYRSGISVSRYSDPEISWEISTKANYALELTLFESLDVVAEYYTEHRRDILQTRSTIPHSMGLWATPKANLGEAKGHGTDISVDYAKSFGKFWAQIRANFTYSTNEYTVCEDYDYQVEWWKLKTGNPTTQNYGYIAEGLFVDDLEVLNSPRQFGDYMAGDIKYHDLNRDGVISDRDMAPIGYPITPEIVYGFGATLGWKNWDFSFFFNGLARESFWINYENVSPFLNTNGSRIGNNALARFIADSHWSEDNRNGYAVWPRLSETMVTNNNQPNTWFMRNGSFMRLKQVELGYSLPKKIIDRAGLKNLRVYFSGNNLLYFSKFKLWDPEMAGDGLGYPLQRVLNFGVYMTF